MIVVDTSALIAISFGEPDKALFEGMLAADPACFISAVNAHEAASLLRARQGQAAEERFWWLLADLAIEIIPFDEVQVRAAVMAYGRFGKGIHPRARLNICDCAAYALAKTLDAPLLFKGDDFSHTDLRFAL